MNHILNRAGCYKLPGDINKSRYIIPVSGGADSSVMAIVMKAMFPNVQFDYVFTDTKAEEPEIYVTLEKLEAHLGVKIKRYEPARGLYEELDHNGGFLPSHTGRWCTRQLKLAPFKAFLETLEPGLDTYLFVGIRADESFRVAFTLDEASTEMPFMALGVKRSDVYRILKETIGIPRYYKRRTRSGCSSCFFQRRNEVVGLLEDQPEEFKKVMFYEKVDPSDLSRYTPVIPFSEDCEIAPNWMTLPYPAGSEMPSKVGQRKSLSLFPNNGIFVGAEFFMHHDFAGQEFCSHQRIVSYSTSKSGISTQLKNRFHHLLSTYEVYEFFDEQSFRDSVRFAIYYVECPSDLFDPAGPMAQGTYTWHDGESMSQMQHIIGWAYRILHAEGLLQVMKAYEGKPADSWEGEQYLLTKAGLDKVKSETGMVVNSMWHLPPDPDEDDPDQYDEKHIACPMCSI